MWYDARMTTKDPLTALIERVATWPKEARDELADVLHDIEDRHVGIYKVSADERAGVERGLADMREGNFASDEEVATIFRRARGSE